VVSRVNSADRGFGNREIPLQVYEEPDLSNEVLDGCLRLGTPRVAPQLGVLIDAGVTYDLFGRRFREMNFYRRIVQLEAMNLACEWRTNGQ
jgi:hypothetical protein